MKHWTARPYVGAPDESLAEKWAIVIAFVIVVILCGWAL